MFFIIALYKYIFFELFSVNFLGDKNLLSEIDEEKIKSLLNELSEVLRERDTLLEQVEQLKEDHAASLNITKELDQNTQNVTNQRLFSENKQLKNENENIKQQLLIMTRAIEKDEGDFNKEDRVVSELLKQINELREENISLKNKLDKLLFSKQVITEIVIKVTNLFFLLVTFICFYY